MSLKKAQLNIKNLKEIKKNIKKLSKTPKKVKIIAVTKTFSQSAILEAQKEGLCNIGENKVQETISKNIPKNKKLKIHFIGKLQSNKVKKAVEIYDIIQTVDRYKIAEKINKEAEKIQKIQQILIQVNISKSPTQSGIGLDNTERFIKDIFFMKNIKVIGLMSIGANTADVDIINGNYKELNKKLSQIKKKYNHIKELSIGMTSDYKIALKNGSTFIRLGTILFGNRQWKIKQYA